MSEPLHPTCVETASHAQLAAGVRSYVCGQDCPRPAGPDPARDARVAKRRAEDAAAAGRALDRLFRVGNHQPQNVYRGEQYIGVMFSAEDAAGVVEMMNRHECRACPASCGSCVHDPDCECYEHQDNYGA